jgi:hypothetical protein
VPAFYILPDFPEAVGKLFFQPVHSLCNFNFYSIYYVNPAESIYPIGATGDKQV